MPDSITTSPSYPATRLNPAEQQLIEAFRAGDTDTMSLIVNNMRTAKLAAELKVKAPRYDIGTARPL